MSHNSKSDSNFSQVVSAQRLMELSNFQQSMFDTHFSTPSPSSFRPQPRRETSMAGAITLISGAFFLLFLALSFRSLGLGLTLSAVFAIVGVISYTKLANAESYNHRLDTEEQAHLEHLRQMERTRLGQRDVAMNSLKDVEVARINGVSQVDVATITAHAQVEAAKYQALGGQQDREFQKEFLRLQESLKRIEEKQQQDWRSIEASLDRTHELDKLRERFSHDLEMWREKIESDFEFEPKRRQAEIDAWDLEKLAMDAIDTETDEDKRERLIRAYERRMTRRHNNA